MTDTVSAKELREAFRDDVALKTEVEIVAVIRKTGASVIEAFAALSNVYFDIIEEAADDVKERTQMLDFVMERLVGCANHIQNFWNDELDEPVYEPGKDRYAVNKV